MIKTFLISLFVITWFSYGMHVIKEFVRIRLGDYND